MWLAAQGLRRDGGFALSLDDVIRHSRRAHTRSSLAADLAALGLCPGDTVIVHSALSRIGYVAGGSVAVIGALLDVLGPAGTLVMPAQSADLTDPASWRFPAVPPDWVDVIRDATPPYDPARTPTWNLGAIAELFRTWPGVGRSAHPVCSFAAFGPRAEFILKPHGFDDPFGEASPLARLYGLDARILLIGTGWAVATALHLAERRADPLAEPEPCLSPVLRDGRRVQVNWAEYPHDSANFVSIGSDMERDGLVRVGLVGEAATRFARMRHAIDFAVPLLRRPELL